MDINGGDPPWTPTIDTNGGHTQRWTSTIGGSDERYEDGRQQDCKRAGGGWGGVGVGVGDVGGRSGGKVGWRVGG